MLSGVCAIPKNYQLDHHEV